MLLIEEREGRMTTEVDPFVCQVSNAIAHVSAQVDVQDISVSGISAEEMVAALYREYRI
jgi:ABC-2 type transport system ATP-binding protein